MNVYKKRPRSRRTRGQPAIHPRWSWSDNGAEGKATLEVVPAINIKNRYRNIYKN
jgi:hypothetical protein